MIINLARAKAEVGDHQEADRLAWLALRGHRKRFGDGHPLEASAAETLGRSFAARGALTEAESWFEKALDLYRAGLPSLRMYMALAQAEFAEFLAAQGDGERAEALYRESLTELEQVFENENPLASIALFGLAVLDHRAGRLDRAEGLYRRALEIRATAMPAEAPERQAAAEAYARLLRELGRGDEAAWVEERLAVTPRVGDASRQQAPRL